MTWAVRPGSAGAWPGWRAAVRRRLGGAGLCAGRRCCGGRGVFNSDELRDAIERLPPQEYLAASYYERWLGEIEMLVTEKGTEMGPETGPEMGPEMGTAP